MRLKQRYYILVRYVKEWGRLEDCSIRLIQESRSMRCAGYQMRCTGYQTSYYLGSLVWYQIESGAAIVRVANIFPDIILEVLV